MPRRETFPPAPHLHRASGQWRVHWRGRHYYLGPADTPEACRRYAELLVRLTAERDAGPPPARPRDGLTVAELLERWDEHAARYYDPAGREVEQYRCTLSLLLRTDGPLPAAAFGLARLTALRDGMIGRGWCRAVVNRRVNRVRTVWRWAERQGLVPAGSWAALRALEPLSRADRRVREAPPRRPAEWRTLAAVCRRVPPAVRDLLLLCWYTGMRPSEARIMRAGDIDTSGPTWVYRPGRHKCAWRGQRREVYLGPRCRTILSRRLPGLAPGDPVLPSQAGRCYSMGRVCDLVRRGCELAGVELTAYQLRHAAKRRLTRELGLDTARSALGQASLDTADRYAAGQDATLAERAARLLG